MSTRSGWCQEGRHDECRFALCGCWCGHESGSTTRLFSAKSNTSATRIEAQMKIGPDGCANTKRRGLADERTVD